MSKKVYDYLSMSHLQELCRKIRRNPFDEETNYMLLDDHIAICDRNPHLLLNALIANTLDSYNIYDRRSDFIFQGSYSNNDPYNYMEKILKVLLEMNIPNKEYMLKHILFSIKSCVHLLTVVVDNVISLGHSLDDYLDTYDEDSQFRNLIDNPILLGNENPYDAWKKVTELPELFKDKIDVKPLTSLMNAGVKVSKKQVLQNLVWAFVPNVLDPSRMGPYLVPDGCLTGYKHRNSFYIDMLVAHKAILTTKSEVQTVGVCSKRTGTALMGVTLNAPKTRVVSHDCGSKRHLAIRIESEKDLRFNRYAYFLLPNGKYDYIDIDRTDLIGKTLLIRSMMLCNDPDHVCEMCFGHMYEFNQDTAVTKYNFHIQTLEEISKKLQGVISIKHSMTGELLVVYVTYDNKIKEMHINDFVKMYDFVKRFEYDKVIFDSKKYNIDTFKNGRYYQLYIDGVELKLNNSHIVEVLGYNMDKTEFGIKITLPNKSVLTDADDMLAALNKHDKSPEFSEGWDKDKTIDQQLQYIFDYFKKTMKLDHRRYIETLVTALARDKDTPAKKVRENSRGIKLIKVIEVVRNASYSDNLSSTLPYAFFNEQIMSIKNPDKGGQTNYSDYDVLYMEKDDTEISSPYAKISSKIAELVM